MAIGLMATTGIETNVGTVVFLASTLAAASVLGIPMLVAWRRRRRARSVDDPRIGNDDSSGGDG